MMRLGILLAVLLLPACSDRPAWTDGRLVREERVRGAAPQDLRDLPARLLVLHNRERAAAGTPPLAWDRNLAVNAAAYGPQLASRGKLAHAPAESRPGQGENLWMGTKGAYSLEEMAGSWAEEKRLFRAGIFPDVYRSGRWSDVAHYTQMIWRGTARVGCALHRGRDRDYLICRYSPPGNVVGQRVP